MNSGKFKKGHIMTPEMREKISKKLTGFKRPPETILKMRIAQKGKPRTKQQIERHKIAMTGRKQSPEVIAKRLANMRREKHPMWKGGITPVVMQIRNSLKMRQWRSDVFHRDDFTCQECFTRGGKLNAHHIKSFTLIFRENNIKTLEDAIICEEFWDINNGTTLCESCHRKINTRRDG